MASKPTITPDELARWKAQLDEEHPLSCHESWRLIEEVEQARSLILALRLDDAERVPCSYEVYGKLVEYQRTICPIQFHFDCEPSREKTDLERAIQDHIVTPLASYYFPPK